MTVKLSRRLRFIVDFIPPGARVVDVGTDHALLPIYLVENQLARSVIATDIADGPVQSAVKNVRQAGLFQDIAVRCGSGLTTVSAGEVDTCVIAGMGGGTAAQVLTESPAVVDKLSRIIVQPMNASGDIRRWLRTHGFGIAHEIVLIEDNRLYVVIAADNVGGPDVAYAPFTTTTWLSLAEEFGPTLLAHPTPEFHRLVHETTAQWERALAGMRRAVVGSTQLQQAELEGRISAIRAWLAAEGKGEDFRAIIARRS